MKTFIKPFFFMVLIFLSNMVTQTMEPKKNKPVIITGNKQAHLVVGPINQELKWPGILTFVLIDLSSLKFFFSYVTDEADTPEAFKNLPQKTRKTIVQLLNEYSKAKTLEEAGQIIYKLTEQNEQINQSIHHELFILLLDGLMKKFKRSKSDVLNALMRQEGTEPMQEKKISFKNKVKQIIVGEKKVQELAGDDYLKSSLPIDLQKQVISLLSLVNDHLITATHAIRTLTEVSKVFYNIINEPRFCLSIIKSLSERFNCSNLQACSELKIICAKNREQIQINFLSLCNQKLTEMQLGRLFYNLKKDNFDFNFTYKDNATPIILALKARNKILAFALLAMGADPELSDSTGNTPLSLAQGMQDEELIQIIKESITKKHQK